MALGSLTFVLLWIPPIEDKEVHTPGRTSIAWNCVVYSCMSSSRLERWIGWPWVSRVAAPGRGVWFIRPLESCVFINIDLSSILSGLRYTRRAQGPTPSPTGYSRARA